MKTRLSSLPLNLSRQNNQKRTQVGNTISEFFTPNPFAALSEEEVLTQLSSNCSPKKIFQQTTTSANKTIASYSKITNKKATEKPLSVVSAKKNPSSTHMLSFGLCRLVLSGGVLVSNLTLAAANKYDLDFKNPHTGFNTEYTLVSSDLTTLARIISRIVDKCGGFKLDFRISPAIYYVIYNIWGVIRSRSSEGDREESFDDCIKEQVKFVAKQNNVILGTILGVGGGILAICLCHYKCSRFFSRIRNFNIISRPTQRSVTTQAHNPSPVVPSAASAASAASSAASAAPRQEVVLEMAPLEETTVMRENGDATANTGGNISTPPSNQFCTVVFN